MRAVGQFCGSVEGSVAGERIGALSISNYLTVLQCFIYKQAQLLGTISMECRASDSELIRVREVACHT